MRRFALLIFASFLPLLAVSSAAWADPSRSSNTLTLQETCSDGNDYTLVTPAAGRSLLHLDGTDVQLTRQLTVTDPLNELGGSFSVPLQPGFTLDELVKCTGTVVGTSVTFTSYVQVVPG